jgi:hypothetical protein
LLPLFPSMQRDEPLYSAIARYGDIMAFESNFGLSRDVFGVSVTPVVDLPGRVAVFVSRLLPSSGITARQVLMQHTALPYHAAFLPPSRVRKIVDAMINTSARVVTRAVGRSFGIAEPLFFRYCRSCVEQDREDVGVPYWRRLHQLAGVIVCPDHGEALLETSLSRWGQGARRRFVSLAAQLRPKGHSELRVDDMSLALEVAAQCRWLLQHGLDEYNEGAEPKSSVSRRLHSLLAQRGFVTRRGRTQVGALGRFLNENISTARVLELSRSERRDARTVPNDAAREIRFASRPQLGSTYDFLRFAKRIRQTHHPVVYVAVINALGQTMQEFFSSGPRGELVSTDEIEVIAPAASVHRCFSPICRHSAERDASRAAHVPPASSFRIVAACAVCGFMATQTRSRGGLVKLRVSVTGPLWDSRLRQMVDERRSSVEISRTLGVSRNVLKWHLVRLNIWPPSWSKLEEERVRAIYNAATARPAEIAQRFQQDLEHRRKRFLQRRAENPTLGRSALRALDNDEFVYLSRWDAAWLAAHLPDLRTGKHSRPRRVEWAAQDALLLPKVREAVAVLRDPQKRPEQVSLTRIANQLRMASTLRRDLRQLPQTRAFVESVLETSLLFARRRVIWAVSQLVTERAVVSRWHVQVRAALRPNHVRTLRELVDDLCAWATAFSARDTPIPLPPAWATEIAAAPWEPQRRVDELTRLQ